MELPTKFAKQAFESGSPSAYAKTDSRERMIKNIHLLRERHGLYLDIGPVDAVDQKRGILGDQALPHEVLLGTAILLDEVLKYPQEFLKFCNIHFIKLVHALYLSENRKLNNIGGVASGKNKGIYLSVGEGNLFNLGPNFHHELFHRADQEDLSLPFSIPSAPGMFFPFNQEFFNYAWEINHKASYRHDYDVLIPMAPPQEKGYTSEYGRINACEDRATIASALMTSPDRLAKMCKDDHILNGKVKGVKRLYSIRSGYKMDDIYFQDLADGKVAGDYWQKRRVRFNA